MNEAKVSFLKKEFIPFGNYQRFQNYSSVFWRAWNWNESSICI